MRRLVANVLSIVALAAVVALWARSRHHHDELTAYTAAGRCASVGTHGGGIHLAVAPAVACPLDWRNPNVTILRNRRPLWVGWSSWRDPPPIVDGDEDDRYLLRDEQTSGLPLPTESDTAPLHAGFGHQRTDWMRGVDIEPEDGPPAAVSATNPPSSWSVQAVQVPFWFLLSVAAAWPVAWIVNRFRPRPPGRCRGCGYDLRATPGRCPECGRAAAAAAVQP